MTTWSSRGFRGVLLVVFLASLLFPLQPAFATQPTDPATAPLATPVPANDPGAAPNTGETTVDDDVEDIPAPVTQPADMSGPPLNAVRMESRSMGITATGEPESWLINGLLLTLIPPVGLDTQPAQTLATFSLQIDNVSGSKLWLNLVAHTTPESTDTVIVSDETQRTATFAFMLTSAQIDAGVVVIPGIDIYNDLTSTLVASIGEFSFPVGNPVTRIDIALDDVASTQPLCDTAGYHAPTLTIPPDTAEVTYTADPARSVYSPGDVVTVRAVWDVTIYQVTDLGAWTPAGSGEATQTIAFDDFVCPSLLVELTPAIASYSLTTETIPYDVHVTNNGNVVVTSIAIQGEPAAIAELAPGARQLLGAFAHPVSSTDRVPGATIELNAMITGQVPGSNETVIDTATVLIPYTEPITILLDTQPTWTDTACTGDTLTLPTITPPSDTDHIRFNIDETAPYAPGQTVHLHATALGDTIFQPAIPDWTLDDDTSRTATLTITFAQIPCGTPTLELDLSVLNRTEPYASGDVVTYQIDITNTSSGPLHDLDVTAPSLTDLTCDTAPNDHPATIPTLTFAASASCTGTRTITQTDIDNGPQFTVTAAVTGFFDLDTSVTASDSATVNLEPANPALGLALTVNDRQLEYDLNETVSYTVTITNTGNVTLTDIALTGDLTFDPACTAASLAPAAQTVCITTHNITQTDVDFGPTLPHSLSVSGIAPDGETTPVATDSVNVTVVEGHAWLSLAVSANFDDVDTPGQKVVYAFEVVNYGTLTINDLSIMNTTLAITCDQLTLSPGERTGCTSSFVIDQDALDIGGVIEHDAFAFGTTMQGGSTFSSVQNIQVSVIQNPAITLSIQATSITSPNGERQIGLAETVNDLMPGDVVGYRVTLANTGNVTLVDVVATPGTLVCDEEETLAPGQSITCVGSHTVSDDDMVAWHDGVDIVVAGSAMTPKTGPLQLSDSITIWPRIPAPMLSLAITPDRATVSSTDEVVAYQVIVANPGPVLVENLSVTGANLDDDPDCAIPDTLEPGASLTCTGAHTVAQADLDTGSFDISVTATGNGPGDQPVTAAKSATTQADQAPAFTFAMQASHVNDMTVNGPVGGLVADDVVTYTLTFTNTGNVTLHDLDIVDVALDDLTCDHDEIVPGTMITCTGTLTIRQTDVDLGAPVTQMATVLVTAPDGSGLRQTASTTVHVADAAPGIALIQSVSPETVTHAGDTIVWSFAVTNIGNVTITDVVVDAPDLRARLIDVSCPEASVAPGEVLTCTASLPVSQSFVDLGHEIVSHATASGLSPDRESVTRESADPRLVVSEPSSTTLTVTQSPSLMVVLTGSIPLNEAIREGTVVTWKLEVTNNGNVTQHDVTFGDLQMLDVYHGGSGSENLGSLAPGQMTTTYGTSLIQPGHLQDGEIRNEVQVFGSAAASPLVSFTLPLIVSVPPTPTPSPTAAVTPTPLPTRPSEPTPALTPTPRPTEPSSTQPDATQPEPTATSRPSDSKAGKTPTPMPGATGPNAPQNGSGSEIAMHQGGGQHAADGELPGRDTRLITALPSTGHPVSQSAGWAGIAALVVAALFGVIGIGMRRRNDA